LILFSVAALFVVSLSNRQRDTAKFLSQARDELASKVRELEKANQTLHAEIAERQRSARLLATQHAVTRVLAECGSLVAAAADLLRDIGLNMKWDWGALWIAENGGAPLRCETLWSAPNIETAEFDAASRELPFMSGQGVVGQVWQHAIPRW